MYGINGIIAIICPALAAGPASTSGIPTKCEPGAGKKQHITNPPPHRAILSFALCGPAARVGLSLWN